MRCRRQMRDSWRKTFATIYYVPQKYNWASVKLSGKCLPWGKKSCTSYTVGSYDIRLKEHYDMQREFGTQKDDINARVIVSLYAWGHLCRNARLGDTVQQRDKWGRLYIILKGGENTSSNHFLSLSEYLQSRMGYKVRLFLQHLI
jgi:hypothetical protein